jgi:hypothetical protein
MIRIEQSEFCRMLFKSRHATASSNRQYNAKFTGMRNFISEGISHKLLWNPPSLPYTVPVGFLGTEECILLKIRVFRSVGRTKCTLTYGATGGYRTEDKLEITLSLLN